MKHSKRDGLILYSGGLMMVMAALLLAQTGYPWRAAIFGAGGAFIAFMAGRMVRR